MEKINEAAFEVALKTLVKVYNGIVKDPGKRLALINQGTGKMAEVKREIIVDTTELYVCVYNDKCISVFEREYYRYNYGNWTCLAQGSIYHDLFSDEVGIYGVAGPRRPVYAKEIPEKWQPVGFQANGRTATCNMFKAVKYEEVRKALKNAKEIGEFKPGKTTASEIDEVLKHAPEYLGLKYIDLTQEPGKTKQKV